MGYIKIVTKEVPIEQTIDLEHLIGRKVISSRGVIVGKIKRIRINSKLSVEGIFIKRGAFKKVLYINSNYFNKLSEEAIILNIDPFIILKGLKVLTSEGEVIGRVKDFVRSANSNDFKEIVVKSFLRKKLNIGTDNIKSIGESIILKGSYSVAKRYIWQGS